MQAYLSQQEISTEPKILNDYAVNGSDYLSDESICIRRSVVLGEFLTIDEKAHDNDVKEYIKEKRKKKSKIQTCFCCSCYLPRWQNRWDMLVALWAYYTMVNFVYLCDDPFPDQGDE